MNKLFDKPLFHFSNNDKDFTKNLLNKIFFF